MLVWGVRCEDYKSCVLPVWLYSWAEQAEAMGKTAGQKVRGRHRADMVNAKAPQALNVVNRASLEEVCEPVAAGRRSVQAAAFSIVKGKREAGDEEVRFCEQGNLGSSPFAIAGVEPRQQENARAIGDAHQETPEAKLGGDPAQRPGTQPLVWRVSWSYEVSRQSSSMYCWRLCFRAAGIARPVSNSVMKNRCSVFESWALSVLPL